MTLSALQGLPADAIEGILATALLTQVSPELLPYGHQAIHLAHSDCMGRVLREVRQRLGLDEEDESTDSKVKVADALESLLNESTSSETLAVAKARLGERGELWPLAYRIRFADGFPGELGISRDRAIEVLRKPDAVQHLSAASYHQSGDSVSLYAKRIERKKRRPYVTLILTKRHGDEQLVSEALRVLVDDTHKGMTPLELLEEFLSHHGLPLSVGKSELTRLALYRRVPEELEGDIVFVPYVPNVAVSITAVFRKKDGFIDVSLACALNCTSYREMLRKEDLR